MKKTSRLYLVIFFVMAVALSSLAQPAPIAQNNILYRIKEVYDSSATVSYRNSFTYDPKGRPLTRTSKFYERGKLYSSETYKYLYDDNTGKLTSQDNKRIRYSYFYGQKGSLTQIKLEFLIKNKWELKEETLIDERPDPLGNGKLVMLRMHKDFRYYCKIEYKMDSGDNVTQSKVFIYHYDSLKTPAIYIYHHDNNPNPLQNMFIQRWYQFDLENGGLNNVLYVTVPGGGNLYVPKGKQEYNEAGYPSRFTQNKHRIFLYDTISIPQPEKEEAALTHVPPQHLHIYPNPATINFSISADGLGKGNLLLRIYEISTGRAIKKITYDIDGKLQALIPTFGMPAGAYIVELISGKTIITGKLIVE